MCIQSDWGGEYRSLVPLPNTLGIRFRDTCLHTQQQSSTAEKKHQHIVEMSLTLLAQSRLPSKFWWEALLFTVFLINRLPTPTLSHISPLEKSFNVKPDYSFLKVFGCSCYLYLRPYQSHKLSFRTAKCIFLGYSPEYKGHSVFTILGEFILLGVQLLMSLSFPILNFSLSLV